MFKYNKYKSTKIKIDGKVFDSKSEGTRFKELETLQEKGMVKDLQTQITFEIQSKFIYQGKTERAIKYIADFVYLDVEKNKIIVEDRKGFKTKEYLIKRKILIKNIIIPNGWEFLES